MWKKKLGIFLRCFSLELATDYLTVAMNWGQFSKIFGLRILRILNYGMFGLVFGVWHVRYTPSKKNLLEEKDQIFGFKVVFWSFDFVADI